MASRDVLQVLREGERRWVPSSSVSSLLQLNYWSSCGSCGVLFFRQLVNLQRRTDRLDMPGAPPKSERSRVMTRITRLETPMLDYCINASSAVTFSMVSTVHDLPPITGAPLDWTRTPLSIPSLAQPPFLRMSVVSELLRPSTTVSTRERVQSRNLRQEDPRPGEDNALFYAGVPRRTSPESSIQWRMYIIDGSRSSPQSCKESTIRHLKPRSRLYSANDVNQP